MEKTVRLIGLELYNFKNVEYGKIPFVNYNSVLKGGTLEHTDIMALYGQNGSGKTALIESLQILKSLLQGEDLLGDKILLIHENKNTVIKVILFVEGNEKKHKVTYTCELRRQDEKASIRKEILEISTLQESKKWGKNYVYTYKESERNEGDKIGSYIFSAFMERADSKNNRQKVEKEVWNDYKEEKEPLLNYKEVIVEISLFAKMHLFIITVEQLGLINMSNLMPLYFQIENRNYISSGDIFIHLFDETIVPKESYSLVEGVKDQINIVLSAVIQGLEIDIEEYGEERINSGEIGKKIEFVALRYGRKFPLKYESEGIKRIISILSTLIAVYSKKNLCLVVDEFDSGIFEYLLGQILEILDGGAVGQFIFTSHNLRALEVLPKNKIMFSTSNPKNRYLIIKGVRNNMNLRDFYLRSVLIGGQSEVVYEDSNLLNLKRAFRKAGKSTYGKE